MVDLWVLLADSPPVASSSALKGLFKVALKVPFNTVSVRDLLNCKRNHPTTQKRLD